MKTIFFVLFLIAAPILLISQIKIGDNPNQINSSALLELESTNKGLIIPRILLNKLNDPSPLANHVKGMLVYNTKQSGVFPNQVHQGYYINDGIKWVRILDAERNGHSIGDVKHSFSTTDHNGWYQLNGRLISSLTGNSRLAAESLFSGSIIPNASGRFLLSSNFIGNIGGTSDIFIAQENLPSLSYDLTTTFSGEHEHSVNPPPTRTTNDGGHNHSFRTTPNLSQIDEQGYPRLNKHRALRTTDQAGLIHNDLIITEENDHTHEVDIRVFGSGDAPPHQHNISFSNGGENVPINFTPRYLSVKTFIYLGE